MKTPGIGHNKPPIKYTTVKLTDIPATLYQRGDVESGFWYVRFWFKEERRYKTFSTATNILTDAKVFALEKYVELKIKKKEDIPIFSKTFGEIGRELLKQKEKEADRGEVSLHTTRMLRSKLERFYIPYFGKRQISTINQKDIDDFWDWRIDYWKNHANDKHTKRLPHQFKTPKGITLHEESNILNKIFDRAIEHGFVRREKKPNLKPPVKKEIGSRSALLLREFRTLYRYMRKWVKADKRSTITYARNRMMTAILVGVSSGMRPPECYNLTWNDIEIVRDGDFTYTLLHVWGKGKKHSIACNRRVSGYLQHWKEQATHIEKTDYVFADISGERCKNLNTSFKRLLTAAGIPLTYQKQDRTWYSLRHTYATFRLRYGGVSVFELAENMDTSVQMIKDHYGHVKSTDFARSLIGAKRRY